MMSFEHPDMKDIPMCGVDDDSYEKACEVQTLSSRNKCKRK